MSISIAVRALCVDTTTLGYDTIVSAANSPLFDGGSVDGAIHRVTGPELLETCRAFHSCHTGGARLVPGFRLPVRYVVHTVGPIWHGGRQDEAALLVVYYRNGLELAREHEVRSVALPYISTGVHGFPLQLAAPTVVCAAREYGAGLDAVTFCCFSATHPVLYEVALASNKWRTHYAMDGLSRRICGVGASGSQQTLNFSS